MPTYIEFSTVQGPKLYWESETTVVTDINGKVAAIGPGVQRLVTAGSDLFENTVSAIVEMNARVFYRAVAALPKPPSEATLEFGLKASAELGNVIVSKASAEANYTIKLTWKDISPAPKSNDERPNQ